MPLYEFRRPDGQIVDHFMHAREVPSVGETLVIDGVPCVRVFSKINQGDKEMSYTSDRFNESEGAGSDDAVTIERVTGGAKVKADGSIDFTKTSQRKKYWKWLNDVHRESIKPQTAET